MQQCQGLRHAPLQLRELRKLAVERHVFRTAGECGAQPFFGLGVAIARRQTLGEIAHQRAPFVFRENVTLILEPGFRGFDTLCGQPQVELPRSQTAAVDSAEILGPVGLLLLPVPPRRLEARRHLGEAAAVPIQAQQVVVHGDPGLERQTPLVQRQSLVLPALLQTAPGQAGEQQGVVGAFTARRFQQAGGRVDVPQRDVDCREVHTIVDVKCTGIEGGQHTARRAFVAAMGVGQGQQYLHGRVAGTLTLARFLESGVVVLLGQATKQWYGDRHAKLG